MENINKYLNMLLFQQKIELISIALNLKLFKLLSKEDYTLSLIYKKLNTDTHNTKVLLDGLILLDLIFLDNKIYKNTEICKKFFIYGSKSYCGDVFLHKKDMLSSSSKLTSSLVKEGSLKFQSSKHPEKWADAAKLYIKQEQKNIISPIAVDIIKKLSEFPTMNKFLDLGCSSGIVGLDIVKNHPSLKGVLFDYEEVIDVSKIHIKEYELEHRVSTLTGDIKNDDIGSGYDLIWCSNIIYFFENKHEMIQKIYDSLNPNGILISAHVEIDEQDKIYENSYFYFLFLNMQEKTILKPSLLSNTFKEIGFSSIDSFTSYDMPMVPTQIHIVKK